MCGNPADRSVYQIAVLKETEGRGGSLLMHRIFNEGRKIFVSKPINHFELAVEARQTYLMAGGIGVTPLIAMAHELHAKSADFELHYSGRSRESMAFLYELSEHPWASNVHLHISDEGTRLDLNTVFKQADAKAHVYTCGAEPYMDSVLAAAKFAGVPEDNRHLEFFSVPEVPEYENHAFTLKLARSGKTFTVPANQSPAEVLQKQGYPVDIKCSDGLCGVCRCTLVSGSVEHRDYVLSKKQRQANVILCQSRAAEAGGEMEIDL